LAHCTQRVVKCNRFTKRSELIVLTYLDGLFG
jgi:hypothetical protein